MAAYERLKEIRAFCEKGERPRTTVRQFLSWFGYAKRGRWIVEEIRDELKRQSLVTKPDFDSTWYDGEIEFAIADDEVLRSSANESVSSASSTSPLDSSNASSGGSAVNAALGDRSSIDPLYRIGRFSAANHPPVCVAPDDSIEKVVAKMLINDYSQLPVVSGERTVKGAVSWKSIGRLFALGKSPARALDCAEAAFMVGPDASLFQVIDLVVQRDFVLVLSPDKTLSGIVTAADLSMSFDELARPFLLLGQIENHIRGLLQSIFGSAELASFCDPNNSRPVARCADLTLGECIRALQASENWARLNLRLDRAIVLKELERVVTIRNDVMHFDPDGIGEDDLKQLESMGRFFESLSGR